MNLKYLLVLRYSLMNLVGLVFLIVLVTQGYVVEAIKADVTYIVLIILFLFLIGLTLATLKTVWISREINFTYESQLKKDSVAFHYLKNKPKDAAARRNYTAALRIKLANKINYIRFIANTLVILGLIGTVIGFIIALSGVDKSVSSNPEEISKMVSTLIQGMSVALYTTLAGSIFSVWLNICFQILSTGANRLLSRIIEMGEVNDR